MEQVWFVLETGVGPASPNLDDGLRLFDLGYFGAIPEQDGLVGRDGTGFGGCGDFVRRGAGGGGAASLGRAYSWVPDKPVRIRNVFFEASAGDLAASADVLAIALSG